MIKVTKAQCERAPNVSQASAKEETAKFVYRHGGYLIEAKQTIELLVKKCK